ncbi:malto-oligosyltrehalose synthase [Methyloligella solikamskensis]|uniref:Malto-oligosyltrehalose synthase n=1 Tax=Methyloligella solikamskensis TaxID=1177756 RepID=A0ABW3J861_9HYPH
MRPFTATYRLQFREGVGFKEAADLAPYLRRLGISHLYASPIFEAVPGSTHGYDTANYNRIEASLGGREGLEEMVAALKKHGLQLILDFVPNHMGASPFNSWWCDVLEWGEQSPYAHHFDIDWSAPKLLIPALGEPYGLSLANGAFGIDLDAASGGLNFTAPGHELPMTPQSYATILTQIEDGSLEDLANRFAIATPETTAELKTELRDRLQDDAARAKLETALDAIVADRELMHQLHEAQVWRLAFWRAARETLTYRRFFEVTDLVGVRMEQPSVFEESHRLILDLVGKNLIQGIRLDHIDGLSDPLAYFLKLQEAVTEATNEAEPYLLLIEKILGQGETLRRNWPVAGTTGYEFIRSLAGLFTDPNGESAMTAAYHDFIGEQLDYETLLLRAKRHIFVRNLAGELDVLSGLAAKLAAADLVTRDFGRDTLRRAIIELAVALPVYRTYVDVEGPSAEDEMLIADATAVAKASREVEDDLAIDFIAQIWRLDLEDPAARAEALTFATRFQQTTGPLMAKALEDTLFYRYNRLIALNEVGGEPDVFGAPIESFHDEMDGRLIRQRQGLSTTSTHDTKRGEDARTRLYSLSEAPENWSDCVRRWSEMNQSALTLDEAGERTPSVEDEWLFYQSLAGAWPFGLSFEDRDAMQSLSDRMTAFMLKAIREAKVRTSWTGQDQPYEEAVERFVCEVLDPDKASDFLDDFSRAHEEIALAGGLYSLSQTLIKLTAPGVPDVYRGSELWELSLVDPDNRRPVDFAKLEEMLSGLEGDSDPADLLESWRSGVIKLSLLEKGLRHREDYPALFETGDYTPVHLTGARSAHAVAYLRSDETCGLIAIAPIRARALLEGQETPIVSSEKWEDTAISLPGDWASKSWRNLLTGETMTAIDNKMHLSEVLKNFPVALLASEGS